MRTRSLIGAIAVAMAASGCAVYTPAPVYSTAYPAPTYSAPTTYSTAPSYYPGAVAYYDDPSYGPAYVGWQPSIGYVYLGGPRLPSVWVGRPVGRHYWGGFRYYGGYS